MNKETELDRINKLRLYKGLPKLKEIVDEDTNIDALEKQRKIERHERWLAKKERNEMWSIDKQQKKWINDYYTPNMDTVFYSGLSCVYGNYSGYDGTNITDNSIYFLELWRMTHHLYNDNKKIGADIKSIEKYLEDETW
jgi:hypothetical protein